VCVVGFEGGSAVGLGIIATEHVELAKAWDYDEIYAVFQDSDDTLLIAGEEVYHTDPLKQELEECIGDTLEDLSDDLGIPALFLLQVWWD